MQNGHASLESVNEAAAGEYVKRPWYGSSCFCWIPMLLLKSGPYGMQVLRYFEWDGKHLLAFYYTSNAHVSNRHKQIMPCANKILHCDECSQVVPGQMD